MVRDYEALCDNVLRNKCFTGLTEEARRIRILLSDLKPGTRYNYMVTLKKFIEFADEKGKEPLKFDLVLVKDFLQGYRPTSRQGYGFRLRKIFQLLGEEANFTVRRVENDLPEVLSDDEVNVIVEATPYLKWRTLFRLTYEGAMREHEVLGIKIKHVKFDELGAEVFVPSTKSESLWLRVIDSAPLLQAWIEQHPDRDNPQAWVFPGRKQGEPLTYIAFYLAIKRTAKKLGIKKRVFPHLLRHSRLAWLKKFGAELGISDSIICLLYGRWAKQNAHRMLDRYGKVYPKEANEIILRAYGKLGERKLAEPTSKPQTCPRCHKENDALSKYCRVCGMVLDEKEAVRLMEENQDLQRTMSLLKNPFVAERLEIMAQELAEERKKLK